MNFHPFNGFVNNPKSMSTLVFETIVIGLVAIIFGSLIDKFFKRISERTKKFKILVSIVQIITSGIIIAAMYLYGPSEFAAHFQTTLPGMAFPALFYGVQSNIYTPWQS